MRRLLLLAPVLAFAACTEEVDDPTPELPWTIEPVFYGDQPLEPLGIQLPLTVAVDGVARFVLHRGPDAVGPFSLTPAFSQDIPVEVTVDGDQVTLRGLHPGEAEFDVHIGQLTGTIELQAARPFAATPQPASRDEALRVYYHFPDDAARFVAQPILPITVGLDAGGIYRPLDEGVTITGAPPKVRWSHLHDDVFELRGLPLGTTDITVSAGGEQLTMPVEVVAGVDEITFDYPTSPPCDAVYACGAAWSGGQLVTSYDWHFRTIGFAGAPAPQPYQNCVLIPVAHGVRRVTVEATAAGHSQLVTLSPWRC